LGWVFLGEKVSLLSLKIEAGEVFEPIKPCG
jgi:hypothetical protein